MKIEIEDKLIEMSERMVDLKKEVKEVLEEEMKAREENSFMILILKLHLKRDNLETKIKELQLEIDNQNSDEIAAKELEEITKIETPSASTPWGKKSRAEVLKMVSGGPKITEKIRSQRPTPQISTPSPVPNTRRTPVEFIDEISENEYLRLKEEERREYEQGLSMVDEEYSPIDED